MANEYHPNYVSAPGETIRECLQHHKIRYCQFAVMMSISVGEVKSLLSGRLPVNDDRANRLAIIFGVPSEFWLTREARYRKYRSGQPV